MQDKIKLVATHATLSTAVFAATGKPPTHCLPLPGQGSVDPKYLKLPFWVHLLGETGIVFAPKLTVRYHILGMST